VVFRVVCEVLLVFGEEIVVFQQFVSLFNESVEVLLEGGQDFPDEAGRVIGGRHFDGNVFRGDC
jgi:hypothetical protein